MQTKKCTRCKCIKSINDYYKKSNSHLLRSECKECSNIDNYRVSKMPDGIISKIYSAQKTLSIKRGHKPPSYTKFELSEWIKGHNDFNKIYNNYVDSGFDSNLKPSVDRLDDYKAYSFDNIRLVTWLDNKKKRDIDVIEGRNNKISKEVHKYDVHKKYICSYYSISQAARDNNIFPSRISFACTSPSHFAKGYLWYLTKL